MTTNGRTTGPAHKPPRRSAAKSKQNVRRKTAQLESSARPATSYTSRQRTKRTALRVLKWSAILGLVGAAVGASILALVFYIYGRDPNLPKIKSLNDYHPKQVTRIAASDDTIVGEIYTERRTYVAYEKVPKLVIQAFISAEDANFFEHGGLDYWGMVRAFIVNVRAGKKKQGASTITQQVVKTFLLSPERTLRRKVQEIILARRLEQALTKEEILSLYLNQIYFGHGRYGVHEAARFYFGKDVSELNAGEAALLGGLPQSPERISPKKPQNHKRAKHRQHYVLEQMAHNGYISEAEARKWINAPIAIIREPFPDMGVAPEWIELARQDLIARYGEDAIDTMGAHVVTTLDTNIQRAALAALQQGLRDYDTRQKYGSAVRTVKPDKIDLEVSKLARKLPKDGPESGTSYLAVVREIHEANDELVVDLGKWLGSVLLGGDNDDRFNPKDPDTDKRKTPSERFSVGDVIRVRLAGKRKDDSRTPSRTEHALELTPGAQGAVVVMDPKTREVLALVGGFSSQIGDFNRAIQAKRQPGSSFKPIVYAAALDSGAYTAATIVNDAPEVYDLWKPQNYKKGNFEGPVRLRHALAKSINTVAIRVLHDVGIERVVELAHDMGIQSELPASLSLALGSGEVTPLEMTNTIATLADRGRARPPVFVRTIDGKAVAPVEAREVLTEEVAYVALHMMTSVVQEGTARAARKLDMPVAGKTGTSNDARDAWFLGVTPSYVVGVWVGFDDNEPLGRKEGGGKTALPVFVSLMQAIGNDDRRKSFTKPAGVDAVRIDKASGLLAHDGAGQGSSYVEVFVQGTAPDETALAPDEVSAQTQIESEYDDDPDEFGDPGSDPGSDPDSDPDSDSGDNGQPE